MSLVDLPGDQAALPPAVVELLLNFYVNLVTHDMEEPHRFIETCPDALRIAKAIVRSGKAKTVQRFTNVVYGQDWILSGFEAVARKAPIEIGMIAWTDERDVDLYRYLAASEGQRHAVALPVGMVADHLEERARRGIPTKVLVVHNHPPNPVKALIEEAIDMTLGPSGMDRDTMWTWVMLAWKSGWVIEPEFWLYESGWWRRFRWPSASQWIEWVALAGQLLKEGK